MISFTTEQILAKAEELGIIGPGHTLPAHLRSRVVAALFAEHASATRTAQAADVPVAQTIVVQPGAGVAIDGRPFPWIVQADAIEVTLAPDGSGLVRLTIPTQSVQITSPEGE